MLKAKEGSRPSGRMTRAMRDLEKGPMKPVYAEVPEALYIKLDCHLARNGMKMREWVAKKIEDIK